jgi:serine/threonine-protein kinase
MVYAVDNNIFGLRAGDSVPVPLVVGTGVFRTPAVSPDGKWIAYSSDELGRTEVYARSFPDTKASQRKVSVAGGSFPRWSRDGQELFFFDGAEKMVAVKVTPGPSISTSPPEPLFDASALGAGNPGVGFDVAADGRFLMVRGVGAAVRRPDELILVENFFDELRAKVKK